MPPILIRPPVAPEGKASPLRLQAPPSKSQALRALMAAVLAGEGVVEGLGAPLPQDLELFIIGLEKLGARLRPEGDAWHVESGWDAERRDRVTLDAGDGAAPARFLLALGALTGRPVTLTGSPRLCSRPMGPLLAALTTMGATVEGGPGLPVTVCGPLQGGKHLAIDGQVSSQFLSALLLVAPSTEGGLTLRAVGRQVSRPYLDLTLQVMSRFGVDVTEDLSIPAAARYQPAVYTVEADWSGATALLAAAPYLGRKVVVPGLDPESTQPDRMFVGMLASLGLEVTFTGDGVEVSGRVTRGGVFDLEHCPDAAPALAAVAALAPEEVRIVGAAHLRVKESDRIAALVALLEGVGVRATPLADGLVVSGGLQRGGGLPVRLPVRGDHRMAMAAALLGLRRPVLIDDASCVVKSFPGFFRQWPGVV